LTVWGTIRHHTSVFFRPWLGGSPCPHGSSALC
jgi:hypothetical protein